ncbi:MAG: SPOR domain-containing protein [Bacteroidia bacterium]|nr:SPOR domain-containing protein [Bacteroidia bacterium]MDW8014528.1 SPOR domain-containing protein [Bacteroidia bacterium]
MYPLPSSEQPRLVESHPIRVEWRPSPLTRRLYEKVRQQYQTASTLPGFRVQLAATPSRAVADSLRFYVLENFASVSVYMFYDPPLYKVRAGDFLAREEAEAWLEQYRKVFPGAFIVPDRVFRP